MKCFLHIGTEKTGTTTIQSFLNLNRSKLYSSGFLYMEGAGLNNRNLSVAAYDLNRRDDFTKTNNLQSVEALFAFQKKVIVDYKEELNGKNDYKLIISSEHLQSRLTNLTEIKRLKKILNEIGLVDISIIIYLRDPAEIANSLYSTAVEYGQTEKSPPPPQNKYYENICNHRNTLEKFGLVFGRQSLIPRIFHRSEFKDGSIISDYLEVIGISDYEALDIPENTNKRLSAIGIEILLRVNEKVPMFIQDKPNPVRANLVMYIKRYFSNEKYLMPYGLYQQYDAKFQDSNEWVRKNYFPEKRSLFPQRTYPDEARVRMPCDELDRIADMLANIWTDKQKRILNLIGRSS